MICLRILLSMLILLMLAGADDMDRQTGIRGAADVIDMNFSLSDIDKSAYIDQSVLNGYGFRCMGSRTIGEYSYEILRNDSGETIAVVRSEDRIYCLQYINDADYQESFLSAEEIRGLYGHEVLAELSGSYYHTYHYYMRDGSVVIRVKFAPDDDFEYIGIEGYDGSILKYFAK